MNYKGGEVDFWSTRKTSVNTENNIPFFFKTEDSKIVGMGLLVRKESLTVDEMWNRYGNMNGIDSRSELEEWFSKNKPVEKASCLILEYFVIFENAIDLSVIGLERGLSVKYIRDSEGVDRILRAAGIISISGQEQILNPDAVNAKFGKTLVNSSSLSSLCSFSLLDFLRISLMIIRLSLSTEISLLSNMPSCNLQSSRVLKVQGSTWI